MISWLYEQLAELANWLFSLPGQLGEAALGQIADTLPESVLADLTPVLDWLRAANEWLPISEAIGMTTAMWGFEIAIVGIRFIYKLIRGC